MIIDPVILDINCCSKRKTFLHFSVYNLRSKMVSTYIHYELTGVRKKCYLDLTSTEQLIRTTKETNRLTLVYSGDQMLNKCSH